VELIDSHAHVFVRHFDRDREAVIQRAFDANVRRLVVPGIDVASSKQAIKLANQYPNNLFACAGIHPHDSAGFNEESVAAIRALTNNSGVVAIGEIGLDYYRNYAPVTDQRHAFASQVALAQETDLPIVVHNREAHNDIMAELRPYGTIRGVWHCFIGDRRMAEEGLSLGMYLSFAGPITYPANKDLAEVATWVPLDRILIETDSPYLSPHPNRRDRNEPANVAKVAQRIAELRGISVEDLCNATTANAAALFRLPPLG
jgi:TatD DNase family protein